MNSSSTSSNTVSWIFCAVFVALGVLNICLVHPVPGLFYLLFALIYMPSTHVFLKKRLGFSIPLAVKVILGLVILWMTLAVGDLMEMFEAWYLR